MKKRIFAVVLVIALLLSGCDFLPSSRVQSQVGVKFSEFTYTRPELQKFDDILEKCQKAINEERPVTMLVIYINNFYAQYDTFYTNYNLADLHYCHDMTDSYWEAEYNFCMDMSADVEAKLEEMYRMLALSDYKEELEGEEYFGAGFLDSYTGEAVWNETYMRMAERESLLEAEYFALCAEATNTEAYSDEFYDQYGQRFAQILVDLVAVRQEQAEYLGYDSYAEMAYSTIYGRDYTVAESEAYLYRFGQALGDIYDDIFFDDVWQLGAKPCTEAEIMAYAEETAQAMGGQVLDAFREMEQRQLYDVSFSQKKYDGWFELYLTDYDAPFIFGASWQEKQDVLNMIHEFGHFVNDYVCMESYVGTDVSEVQSQGMEYMSLLYAADEDLLQYKMADSLATYIDQSAYALFELQIHNLKGEELTVENVTRIYTQICEDFQISQGLWNPMGYVDVGHFYTSPMYIVSYVVSNDLALQFYQMEQQQPGAGLEKYLNCLESQDYYILDFADTYGLENPFALDRVDKVEALFEQIFARQLAD